jgi:hypothetical protein
MPFEIKKPMMPKKTFILNRNLHLDKDGKVVEENDLSGVKVLGGKGKALYEEEAKHYGLDESHRVVEEKPVEVKTPPDETAVAEEPVEEEKPEAPEELKGKLPEDFPGHAALAEAGINTYGQLRKVGDLTEVKGIGEATAAKIAEALVAEPEDV